MNVATPLGSVNLAFVFPGQGSQSVGMLAEIAEVQPQVQATYEAASEVLGYDLWRLVQGGPEGELNLTRNTQSALLCAGVALWRVWTDRGGPQPEVMAGHSLGEYTALVCAEAIVFEDAVGLVAERGRLMQEAVPAGSGAMAAVLGLDDDQVQQICWEAAQGEVVSAANFNAPGQVVVAGHKAAVERAVELAKRAGARRAVILPVSVPSHCALMEPAAAQLKNALDRLRIDTPKVAVIHNTDASAHDNPQDIRQALAKQLYRPVRWVESIQTMASQGVQTWVECGPGKVLAGLNKRIERAMPVFPVFDPKSLQVALEALHELGE